MDTIQEKNRRARFAEIERLQADFYNEPLVGLLKLAKSRNIPDKAITEATGRSRAANHLLIQKHDRTRQNVS